MIGIDVPRLHFDQMAMYVHGRESDDAYELHRSGRLCHNCWEQAKDKNGATTWTTRVFATELELTLHQIARHDVRR
jgi:hypothetical protein